MSKKTFALKWKPVQLEGTVVNNDIGDLIGIEECTDYDLNSIISGRSKKRKLTSKLESKIKPKKLKTDSHLISSKNEPSTSLAVPETTNLTNDLTVTDINAWSGFGLPELLLKGICEQGFEQPTQIQTLSLPAAVLGRRDILGAAETGSGKTLAFGLPILAGILKIKENEQKHHVNEESESDIEENELLDADSGFGCVKVIKNVDLEHCTSCKPLYALILTPTRELAVQIKNHLVAVAKYTGVKVAIVVGGMAVMKQERILSKGPEIVVATPGRLWELIQGGNSHLSQIDNLRFLAIDETDRMLEKGHFNELHDILERINVDETKRKARQNFVFSATLTLTHELPRHLLVKKKLKQKRGKKVGEMTSEQKLQQIVEMLGITNPKVIDITQKSGTVETLTECRITCAIEEKDYYVYYFLQRHPGRTLIFCNSIGCVKRLTTLLNLLNCNPLALHASMQQRQRLKNLDRFRDNENSILIATDVAARGLDIPCIEHVLHYQTPRTSESYIHRSGRTARVSRQGITVLIIEPAELPNYLRLCRNLGREEDLPTFPVQENILNAVKERVKLARDLDKLDLQVRKANSEMGWIEKAAEEMDIIIDDNMSTKYNVKEARSFKKVAEVKRKQLTQLLANAIFPKGFSYKYPLLAEESNTPLDPVQKASQKAIEVLKQSMENNSKNIRKKAKWLFKPQKKFNIQTKTNVKVVGIKGKKQKKRKP